jgi:hypothetical protein
MSQSQQVGVQVVPDAQPFPVLQPLVGGASGSAHSREYVLPSAAAGQDIPENFQDGAVGDGRSSALGPDGLIRRQVAADQREELLGHAR